ncbi:MAG: prepilin-type N-terminal cleavage/methylation domain-containing protein [Clostridiales bacterium]|nr:prepilin-type N-terminal cleavage/methylation domain-containing protein [Clostridiales bacterium]
MLRISKNKKGFTLVEMIIVVAIVVILAAVLMLNVSQIMAPVRAKNSSASERLSTMQNGFAAYEEKLSGYHF